MLFYSTFPIQNGLRRGREGEPAALSYAFDPVCVIGITDFILEGVPANDDMINYYSVRSDKDPGRLLSQNVSFVTVELPKLGKELSQLGSGADFLFYAIRNMGTMKSMPEEYRGRDLDKLFRLCRFANMCKEEQTEYLAEYMARLDESSRLWTAIHQGKAEGKAEGLAEGKAAGKAEGLAEGKAAGKAEAKLDDARNLKNLGVTPEIISKATGLSLEEISAL